ncbi:GNAT family N-acetyltransferase [Cupriavidus oxalaticus]|uniref:GNAT family N-acetyltransferase n=1 Tax=Cupriavidus oxalaticus TaxID=96344 RepID=UPI003F73C98C
MDAKQQKYRELCEIEPSIPIFSQAWWLDATAGPQSWSAALVERGGRVVAALPYAKQIMHGFVFFMQPSLTQKLGPWFAPMEGKPATMLGQQKELMDLLIEQLPRFDHFQQDWHYTNTNWLPFFWNGYKQTTRYTYVLPDLRSEADLWDGLQPNIRKEIRKASERFKLRVRDDLSIDAFLPLNRLVFDRQGRKFPYDEAYVCKLDSACQARGVRRILIAEDEDGKHHAGMFLVWDANSAYYLMGGGDPQLRNSGATSLCAWEAIRFASTVTKTFDFEGSMLEPVERFFRAFGAEQRPYFTVSKTPSAILSAALFMRTMMRDSRQRRERAALRRSMSEGRSHG